MTQPWQPPAELEFPPHKPEDGLMYQAVLTDIAGLNPKVVAKRKAYAQMAYVLAEQIDSYAYRESTTAADRSAFARMISELRTVMDRLTGVAGDSDDGEARELSIPR